MMRLLLPILLVLSFVSCERRTEVRFEGGNPPSFVLSGSGRLDEILVFAPEQERIASSNPFDDTYAIWEVQPDRDGEDAKALVEDLRVITYGVVPKGYEQIKPKTGTAPPLATGRRYSYWIVTVNAPWAAGYFEIRDGRAVPVPGP
jgi:hypothetical protein